MHHTRTTPEQSVILKQIGYDVPDTHYWHKHLVQGWIEEEGEEDNYNKTLSWYYTRPKLTDVATWLREVKGWHVAAELADLLCDETLWVAAIYNLKGNKLLRRKVVRDGKDKFKYFDTHDIALSNGIDIILT